MFSSFLILCSIKQEWLYSLSLTSFTRSSPGFVHLENQKFIPIALLIAEYLSSWRICLGRALGDGPWSWVFGSVLNAEYDSGWVSRAHVHIGYVCVVKGFCAPRIYVYKCEISPLPAKEKPYTLLKIFSSHYQICFLQSQPFSLNSKMQIKSWYSWAVTRGESKSLVWMHVPSFNVTEVIYSVGLLMFHR